jgi:O-acetyl-ADP-ribose deacetylase (regulator of RNase III)
MIEYKSGDILKEDVEAIVNPVNCRGIMGKGLALQFKDKYPENFRQYKEACKNNEIVPGKMFIYYTNSSMKPRYIINFPTKLDWRSSSKIEYINKGLDDLAKEIERLFIQSIAIPPLGCGFGNLDWDIVNRLIVTKLSKVDCDVVILVPNKNI